MFIKDTEGNVIVDEVLTSYSNGFIDLWLPRNNNYEVTIKHGGKSVKSNLSTFEKDGTCITNMELT